MCEEMKHSFAEQRASTLRTRLASVWSCDTDSYTEVVAGRAHGHDSIKTDPRRKRQVLGEMPSPVGFNQ
jgi:hypothetical protein